MSTESRKLITTLIIVASVLLTPVAVKQAYTMRGYWAFGGEWFLIPLGLLIAQFWKMDKKKRPLPAGNRVKAKPKLPRSSVSHGALDLKRRHKDSPHLCNR